MRAAPAAVLVEEVGRPPIRLRYVLLATILLLAGSSVVPRARAAWQLHALATTFADYALCVAGPMGPSLLRDNAAEFWRLARRRLVTSPADARPFERCAKAAGALTGSIEVERAHLARAWNFVEYGGEAADRADKGSSRELSLDDLSAVNTRVLSHLAERAKPFVRDGYTHLVQPSSAAYEATHPVELPRPALGRGLPDAFTKYRAARQTRAGWLLSVGQGSTLTAHLSRDDGTTWKVAPLHQTGLAEIAGRCPAGDSGAAFTFSLSADRKVRTVRSELPDGTVSVAPLSAATTNVVAASCDAGALVAALARKNRQGTALFVCRLQDACSPMAAPNFPGVTDTPGYPLDLARADGVTVVAMTMHRIVRVASSRDDGQTWAPWTVAYDAAEFPDLPQRTPSHLLVMGRRLLLYAGGAEPSAYPFLVSLDYGASFHAP